MTYEGRDSDIGKSLIWNIVSSLMWCDLILNIIAVSHNSTRPYPLWVRLVVAAEFQNVGDFVIQYHPSCLANPAKR
mgnify:CR=1 FL=1